LLLAYPEKFILIWSINLLISASTVFVKQHYVLDILGGLINFGLSVIIGGLFGKI
jgi:membrane-associated phospholipid phosphatase